MNYNIRESHNNSRRILSLLAITFGVISFITAIIAIWFRLFLVGIIFGIAAIVLGIVSICKEKHKVLGIIGVSTGGICFIVCMSLMISMYSNFYLNAINNYANRSNGFSGSGNYNSDEFGNNDDNNDSSVFNDNNSNSEGGNITTTKDDVIGKWLNNNDGTVFDFKDGSWGLYKDKNESEDNCYKGTMNIYTIQEAYNKGIIGNITNSNKNNTYLIQATINEVKINGLDYSSKYSEKEKSILILVSFSTNKKTVTIFDGISGTNNSFQKIN